MGSIFPLIDGSVLFLVDGSINGKNEIVGKLYPFERFPWNKRPGCVVWSKQDALTQLDSFTHSKYDTPTPSDDVQQQLDAYFQRPPRIIRSASVPTISKCKVPDPDELIVSDTEAEEQADIYNFMYELGEWKPNPTTSHYVSLSMPNLGSTVKKAIATEVMPKLPVIGRKSGKKYEALSAQPDDRSTSVPASSPSPPPEDWDELLLQLAEPLSPSHGRVFTRKPPQRTSLDAPQPNMSHDQPAQASAKNTVPRPLSVGKKRPPPSEPLPQPPKTARTLPKLPPRRQNDS